MIHQYTFFLILGLSDEEMQVSCRPCPTTRKFRTDCRELHIEHLLFDLTGCLDSSL